MNDSARRSPQMTVSARCRLRPTWLVLVLLAPAVVLGPTGCEPTSGAGSAQATQASPAAPVMQALQARDMRALARFVSPLQGLRFSPSAHLSASDAVFTGDALISQWGSKETYTWGLEEGSGRPIVLTFRQYFDRYVYDRDFAKAPDVATNILRRGPTTLPSNVSEVYPNAAFVDYHFPGFDPACQGMDWETLRLVFDQEQGQHCLIAIIHDQYSP
jgi:hypothetical protein